MKEILIITGLLIEDGLACSLIKILTFQTAYQNFFFFTLTKKWVGRAMGNGIFY